MKILLSLLLSALVLNVFGQEEAKESKPTVLAEYKVTGDPVFSSLKFVVAEPSSISEGGGGVVPEPDRIEAYTKEIPDEKKEVEAVKRGEWNKFPLSYKKTKMIEKVLPKGAIGLTFYSIEGDAQTNQELYAVTYLTKAAEESESVLSLVEVALNVTKKNRIPKKAIITRTYTLEKQLEKQVD